MQHQLEREPTKAQPFLPRVKFHVVCRAHAQRDLSRHLGQGRRLALGGLAEVGRSR